jgi:hypothetical protein
MNPVLYQLKRVYDFKVRGVRCVDIVAIVCLAALIFSVYIVKTAAARESVEISSIEAEIRNNAERVRLLRAEATRLEQPARLEALAAQAGLAPVEVKKQTELDALPELAAAYKPAEPAATADAPSAPTVPAVAEGQDR